MPLSDDDLEKLARYFRLDAKSQFDRDVRLGRLSSAGPEWIPRLIAELRAARPIVEAARALANVRPRVDSYLFPTHPPGAGPNYMADLEHAVDEYDAASAEPQEQKA